MERKSRIEYSTNRPSLTEVQSHKCRYVGISLFQHHLRAATSSSSELNLFATTSLKNDVVLLSRCSENKFKETSLAESMQLPQYHRIRS